MIWEHLKKLCQERDALMEELRERVELILQGIDPTTVKHLVFDPKLATPRRRAQARITKLPWVSWFNSYSRDTWGGVTKAPWYNQAVLRDGTTVEIWPPIAARHKTT